MSLTKSTRSSTKTKNKRKKSLSPAEQFQQQWQTVQELQQKSQRIEHEAAELVASVKPKIEASERGRTETVYRLTERILVFMQRKTLPQWCKQELLDWLDDNMMLLMRHPFADHLDVRALAETADDVMHSLWGAPNQPPQTGADGEDDDLRKAAEDIDIEDLFSKLDEAMADDDELDEYDDEFEDSSDDDYFEEGFDHWQEERNHQAQQEQEKQRQLNKLLRTSNINKIFRRSRG